MNPKIEVRVQAKLGKKHLGWRVEVYWGLPTSSAWGAGVLNSGEFEVTWRRWQIIAGRFYR